MRVLVWNLYHGRARPPAGRSLLREFSEAIAGWEWDVALLQEVPPWWPPELAWAAGADQRTVLTSRNAALPLRRFIAERRPDLIKSNGGGSNAILVRAPHEIAEHRGRPLRRLPERRVMHAVRLRDGPWIANLHAQAHSPPRAQADLDLSAATLLEWAGGGPAVLGGDFNDRSPAADGFVAIPGRDVDHLMLHGLLADEPVRVLDRGSLSDHEPLVFAVVTS